jgi:hypothetical protein
VDTIVVLPVWIMDAVAAEPATIRGMRSTLIAYSPAGTPINVNCPPAPVMVTDVSISVLKSSPADTSRSATWAAGPSGPVASPETREVFTGRSAKSMPPRSSPDFTLSAVAWAIAGVPGKN